MARTEVLIAEGMPFPNLPYFLDGDVKLAQASAIQRYICHKWKPELLGRTPAEAGWVYVAKCYS